MVQELLPDMVASELYTKIQKQVIENIEKVAKRINERLDLVDEKQKDFHSFVVRQLNAAAPVPELKKD